MISKPHATETMKDEFGKVAYTVPSTHYIGLSTTPITASTGLGFTEPANVGYVRQAITNNTTNWVVNAAGDIANGEVIEFDAFTATLSGTNITHWFISAKENASATGDRADYFDVLKDSSGNTVTFPVTSGGKIIVAAGNLKLGRTNPG